ncbi:MAG: gamma-glutamyltransferase [Novosphingobium sp.]|nr:gamma-glutamyltransferase [Novosphingobium sp.]
MLLRAFTTALLSLSLAACATLPAPQSTAAPTPTRFEAGMVSAADPRAAEAGAEILRKGGSATDAAIATMLALTVVEPQSSGIGGGGFYVRGNADGMVDTIDGRETAPALAKPDWFLDSDGKPLPFREAVASGLSIGVPGNVALAAEAHRRHGKLAWRDLFAPAIRLARQGWILSERGRDFLLRNKATGMRDKAAAALFYDAGGEPLPVGTKLTNPVLAETLERIAERGSQAFYNGQDGADLAIAVARDTPRKATMTEADVMNYKARYRKPVCGTYRAYKVCGMGPPSSGATTVLSILGMMERFDLSQMSASSPTFWHLFAEAQRLAYADRERFLADPDFVSVPVPQLIDRDYLAHRSGLIRADKTAETVEPGLDLIPPDGDEPPENGTSHFAVVDRDGNAVSYTSTIEGPFGSGLMHDGFFLNNELTDFSFVPEKDGLPVANRVEGGKRPRSSMAPSLVYGPDGKLVLAVGAAGGGTIPVQVTKSIIAFIDWKLPIAEAIAVPVLYSPDDTVIVEKGSALEALIPGLKALGHARVVAYSLPLKTNAVAVTSQGLIGAGDPRSEGVAVSQ